MRPLIDIAGKSFGPWTALSHHHGGVWLCRCNCGTEKLIRSGHLRGGRMTGCLKCRTAAADPILRFAHLHTLAESGCWEWSGGLFKDSGYGRFNPGKGASAYAHRYSYELRFGPIPDRLQVLHRCDNRVCVNPDHLFLGTQLDNMRDMFAKGRNRARGRINLSAPEIEAIRAAQLTGAYGEVTRTAKQFGITSAHFRSIRRGDIWRNISKETVNA